MNVKTAGKPLFPPTLNFSSTFEYSVHSCPSRMLIEMQSIFPEIDLQGLLIIPTFQVTSTYSNLVYMPIYIDLNMYFFMYACTYAFIIYIIYIYI